MIPTAAWPDHELPVRVAHDIETPSDTDLGLYRSALRANAARALSITYPTVASLLGEQGFQLLVARYVSHHPYAQSDWGAWGRSLPAWLAQLPELDAYPYLPDVAKLDWLCHICERAADTQLDLASLQALAERPLEQLCLRLADGVQVMTSIYPVMAIWQGHHGPQADRAHWLQKANVPLPEDTCQYLLVRRSPWRAVPRVISAADHAFLAAVLSGLTLDRCLSIGARSGFDLMHWLPQALQQGLVVGLAD